MQCQEKALSKPPNTQLGSELILCDNFFGFPALPLQPIENVLPYLEVLGDLLEGEEDRLILPLLEHVHQILDLLVPPVKIIKK